jgi:cbb3-type cytochrome oxidase maturation protein
MDILYLLIPISLIIVAIAVWILMWAIRSGQYEDLEGPAHRILMDDDEHLVPRKPETEPEGKRDDAVSPDTR